jgi:hypothetical protein
MFESRVLNKIFGPKREGGSGGRLEKSFIACTIHQISLE